MVGARSGLDDDRLHQMIYTKRLFGGPMTSGSGS